MKIDDLNARFKDAPWYEASKMERILLTGVGGIGSNALYCLAKTIPAEYFIIDNDTVDTHNIGTQFYRQSQIGKPKVFACLENIDYNRITPLKRLVANKDAFDITITGFDNMKARKLVYENWKARDSREILIDGRLRASYYEIFTVTKDNPKGMP